MEQQSAANKHSDHAGHAHRPRPAPRAGDCRVEVGAKRIVFGLGRAQLRADGRLAIGSGVSDIVRQAV